MTITYTRPSLTPEQLDNAYQAVKAMRHKSTKDLLNALLVFIVEGTRLWIEVNDHRQRLGIPPMPWRLEDRI